MLEQYHIQMSYFSKSLCNYKNKTIQNTGRLDNIEITISVRGIR